MRLPFFTVDVFTERRFAGNPLAIVEDSDDLSVEQMQTIAREFNLSETIFVRRPADPAHTAHVRIFFPTAEIPFAGHPTIGCAIHLAQKQNAGDADFETLITLEEVAGLVPVNVIRKQGQVTAQFTAPIIPHLFDGQVPLAEIAADALGLDPADIGFGDHRPGLYAGGPSFVYMPLASRAALEKAKPAEPAWSRMTEAANTVGVYCYTPGGDAPETDYRARMFAPTGGIPEDPATGSASAILAAQLLASGKLKEGVNAFALRQGYEMGRPSQVGLEIDVAGGKLSAVRIAGSSVPVSQGMIEAA